MSDGDVQREETERLARLGERLGQVAHDPSNLLSPVVIGIDLMRRRDVAETSKSILDALDVSTRRCIEMTQQVAAYARASRGEKRLVNVGSLLSELEKAMRDSSSAQLEIDVDYARDLYPLYGDPKGLGALLRSLMHNARDAMPNGGRLHVWAENVELDTDVAVQLGGLATGSHVRIEFADDGVGIPPEIQDRIFEPFFTTKPSGEYVGLGLSTAREVARVHHGALTVASQLGEGCTFTVYLPAAQTTADTIPPSF
jgi:signal transduction histidine kinase